MAGLTRRFHPSARSILELGSGTGLHSIHLAKQGYEVTGVDLSPGMINIARSNALSFLQSQPESQPSTLTTLNLQPVFMEGDIRQIRLGRRFDTVIALFHVISYQTTNDDVTAAFQTAREHLNPGGIFIFDVWYGPAVLTVRPAVRIKLMADDQTEITRLAEPLLQPNENRVDVNYHVFVRDLTPPKLSPN